jgi:hypothetical protein
MSLACLAVPTLPQDSSIGLSLGRFLIGIVGILVGLQNVDLAIN